MSYEEVNGRCFIGIRISCYWFIFRVCCTNDATSSTFTGAFAGVDFGFRSVDYTLTHIRSDAGFSQEGKSNHTLTQSVEGLNGGYGFQFANNLYVGAKAFAQMAQGDQTHEREFDGDVATNIKLQFGNTYGANAQFGYAVSDRFLPYVTAGYEWLNIKNTAYNDFVDYSVSNSNYKGGFDAGAGMKLKVTDHVLINAEFTGAWISTFNKSSTDRFGITHTVKVQPNLYTGLVGVSYLF